MTLKKFKARKGKLFISLSGILLGLLIYSFFSDKFSIVFAFSMLIVLAHLVHLYLTTSYALDSTKFYYRSGFINGEIPFREIKSLEPNINKWTGLKPALASKGILIRYNKFDEIYIAPKNNQEFINSILSLNPSIKVLKAE
ncbi:PH domain-containing protein [Arthrospiribacter ruber]|uniref:Uncharacterized protein YyaB-like PH domain-containing protein n=1 Tax=Arthrospiribacter ruber TaxID=2487934 RepID=A0A951IWD6_9BACT|nr:PH domain-containing protein [Arthrospiribacter ruber]MBW3466763.1 hypothetical protein [Arthrospiribacter ruber]